MCNLHTLACNESLTLKVGTIQIRQLLRLYPGSWLEAGSLYVPELRINAKFECHPPTPANIHEQLEFLRRHDQHSQRLHFLYHTKSQPSFGVQSSGMATGGAKRPSTVGLATSHTALSSCACLGGSPNYYTLVQGEQFFKNTFRLSEQSSFGRSLFRPDVHVLHSHPIFEHRYDWRPFERHTIPAEQLNDEEIFYPFDFCTQPKQPDEPRHEFNDHPLRHSVPSNLYSLSRTSSARNIKPKSIIDQYEHKRSSSSIPFNANVASSSSSSHTASDAYLTPNEQLSSTTSSSQSSLDSTLLHAANLMESSSMSSLTMIQHQSSTMSSPLHSNANLLSRSIDRRVTSSLSSSTDSLSALEEILHRQQTTNSESVFPPQKGVSSSMEYNTIPQSSLCSSSWINLRNQMKMPIPKSTLLCTTYIRYLSHYRSSTWSTIASFPPNIQQDHIDQRPILDFECVSQGFSCSFLSDISPSSQSFSSPPSRSQSQQQQQPLQTSSSANVGNSTRPRMSIAPTISPSGSSSTIATERDVCLRFMGALQILLTPLMLECLTTYIDKWKTFDIHPMALLDGLHIQAQNQSTPAITLPAPIDLSSTKISLQLPKINVCLLQAGLAEDTVQLTELRTPVDIVTMSLFALSCKQIQMETILSNVDQSTAGVFKIQSITGQFRRFENDFSSIENVNIHAIQSQRCRLQFRLSSDVQTHLPMSDNRKNVGFVMNEFGLQRLCFKLVNNAARQQQQRKYLSPTTTQVDETQTTRASSKTKSKRKQSTEVGSSSSSPSEYDGSLFSRCSPRQRSKCHRPPRHPSCSAHRARRRAASSMHRSITSGSPFPNHRTTRIPVRVFQSDHAQARRQRPAPPGRSPRSKYPRRRNSSRTRATTGTFSPPCRRPFSAGSA